MNQRRQEAAPIAGCLLFLMLAFVGAIITGAGCAGPPAADQVQTITMVSEDGVRLEATGYVTKAAAPPGVVLVHGYAGTRNVWEHWAHIARASGMMVVALDLRGHGNSRLREDAPLHYRKVTNWLEALQDISAAKTALLEMGAAPGNLAIGGEGLGANLALHYALADTDIQAVMLISPGLVYQDVTAEREIQALKDCPTLLLVGEGDAYAAMSARTLHGAAPVFSELRSWPGAAHGADLFAAHPEAVHYALQWLDTIFAGELPETP